MRRTFIIMSLISALFLTFASCSADFFTHDGYTWGTSFHIIYKSDQNLDGRIDSVLKAIDRELSMFNDSSTVSAINSGRSATASAAFRDVFDISTAVSALSHGLYDPTVGPLTSLWGFGREDIDSTPGDSAIEAALLTVGIAECGIADDMSVSKKHPATCFDFSSVAKGYGVDRVAKLLDDNGVRDYMIEIGGEITARGHSPKMRPWNIQIDAPTGGMAHESLTVMPLGPAKTSIASSGNYRNVRRDSDGNFYGHTLSPISGRPVAGNVLAATVSAADCATADALATACMACGDADSAMSMLRRAGAEGLLVVSLGDSMTTAMTDKFCPGKPLF